MTTTYTRPRSGGMEQASLHHGQISGTRSAFAIVVAGVVPVVVFGSILWYFCFRRKFGSIHITATAKCSNLLTHPKSTSPTTEASSKRKNDDYNDMDDAGKPVDDSCTNSKRRRSVQPVVPSLSMERPADTSFPSSSIMETKTCDADYTSERLDETNAESSQSHDVVTPTITHTIISRQPERTCSQDVASQLVHDIQLVEQIFQKLSIDTSLAVQVAVTLYSSRHFMALAAEAKQHERLTTQQQHLEERPVSTHDHQQMLTMHSSVAVLYDPNWRDKLRNHRDKCWNAACCLIWEVALAHILVKLVRPIVQLFSHSAEGRWSYSNRILQPLLTNVSYIRVHHNTISTFVNVER